MKNNNFINILFYGQRRVFFLLFAFALLAQIFVFARQNAKHSLGLVQNDFKIVLSYHAPTEKQEALQNVLKHLNGVNSFKQLSSQDIFDIFSKGAKGKSDYVLNPAFVPSLYEIQVSEQVLLDTETWLKNLYNFDETLEIYYKTGERQTALFLKAFIKYIDILAILAVLALVSFGFFAEAYYTQIATAKERLGGILCGLIAGGFVLVLSKVLIISLALNLPYNYTACKEQIIILLLAMALGGTMSKWKKF